MASHEGDSARIIDKFNKSTSIFESSNWRWG